MAKIVYGHVLIVEDNRINQIILKENLSILGYTSDVADNGLVALDLLKSKNYDFVFMDLQMPVMGGVECTRRIRQLTKSELSQITIVAVTANSSPEDQKNCQEVGMNDFIEKPLRRKRLIEVLRKFFPGNHYLNEYD